MKAEFSNSRCPFLISSPLPPCPLMSVKGHNSVWRSWWRKAVACGLELRERGYPRMKYKPYHIDFPFGGPDITPSISLQSLPAIDREALTGNNQWRSVLKIKGLSCLSIWWNGCGTRGHVASFHLSPDTGSDSDTLSIPRAAARSQVMANSLQASRKNLTSISLNSWVRSSANYQTQQLRSGFTEL